MVKFVTKKGNIFDSDADIIVNPVNSVSVMGAGLALDFIKRFPNTCNEFNKDSALIQEHLKKKGRGLELIGPVLYEEITPQILMFPTKIHFKDPSTLDYIIKSAKRTASILRYSTKSKMAISKVGCGLGGLAWKEVRPILEKEFENVHLDIIEFWI